MIDGNPGSGKTYYAVYMASLLSEKEQKKVIHNVDGLKIGRTFEQVEKEDSISIEQIFSNQFHLNNTQLHGSLIILDEASAIFHDKYQNVDTFTFFQQHRHYGLDLILLCPDMKLISYKIQLICEFKYRATSETANPIPWVFAYRKMLKDEMVGTRFLFKKKKVFDLYRSSQFDQKKTRKKSRPMLTLLIIIILASIGTYLYGKYQQSNKQERITKQVEKKQPVEQPKKEKKPIHKETVANENTTYPEELQKKFGGALLPLDTIEDNGKITVIINNVLLPAMHWPYQIIKIEGRYYSIVEDSLYSQLVEEKQKRKQNNNNNLDPNSKYMVSNNSTSIGKETHSKGGEYQQQTIPNFSAATP